MTDYDRTNLPVGYDRARDHGPAVLELWMRKVAEHVEGRSVRRILDLGCGTGRFAEGFMSMSLHHIGDQMLAARECRRVLSDDGRVVVRTGTREQIAAYPYVPFFVSSRRLLEETLPASPELRAVFASAGLHLAAAEIVTQTIAPDWIAYADKLAAGGDSVLARLSKREFERGLAAVRQYSATEGPHPVVEPIDLFVFPVVPPTPRQSRRGGRNHPRQPLLRNFRPLPADFHPQRRAHAGGRTYEVHVASRRCLSFRSTLPHTTFFVSHSAR